MQQLRMEGSSQAVCCTWSQALCTFSTVLLFKAATSDRRRPARPAPARGCPPILVHEPSTCVVSIRCRMRCVVRPVYNRMYVYTV